MTTLKLAFAGCVAVAFGGCNAALFIVGEPGSGTISTVERDVENFNSVSLSGFGKLNITCGQATSLVLTTDDNLIELIETQVDGDALRIWHSQKIAPTQTPEFEISTEQLNSVSVSGSSTVSVSNFEGDSFAFDLSGSGKIIMTGKTERVSISISGSGTADLSQLDANDVDISVSGSGRASVVARKNLDVSISGSGRVDYVGDPVVKKQISGSGRISKAKSKNIQKAQKENNAQVSDSGEEDSEDEEGQDDEATH